MIQWFLQRMREELKNFQRNSSGGCSSLGRVLVEDTAHWESPRDSEQPDQRQGPVKCRCRAA